MWAGVAVDILLATKKTPASLIWFDGKYGDLLSLNLWGSALCFTLFFIPLLFVKNDKTVEIKPHIKDVEIITT